MCTKAPPSIYQSPKCMVIHGSMGYTDARQVSRRSKPWSSLMQLAYIHKVDLVMPDDIYDMVRKMVVVENPDPCYSKVIMSLDQILEGAFFTEYIKRGNVLMLSEGNRRVDNVFTLKEGVLSMYLDKEAYERAGLVGRPFGAKGARGSKPRWIVSYDLRSPSMLRGKRGFDRLVYASKKVLNEPIAWLFCNVNPSTPNPDPLQNHFPAKFTSSPGLLRDVTTKRVRLSVPPSIVSEGNRPSLEMFASELYEWVSLIRLASPRAEASDSVDPYLSTYQGPEESGGQMKLCKMSWQGLLSSEWLRNLLTSLVTTCPSQAWFSLSATEFATGMCGTSNELMLLRPPEAPNEYIAWEIRHPEQ